MSFEFAEVQVFVSQLSRAIDFYQKKIGFFLIQSEDNWAIFDACGIELIIMAGAKKDSLQTGYGEKCETVLCLKSSCLCEDIQKLKAQEVPIIQDIQSVPQGKFAVISDPDGNHIELIG